MHARPTVERALELCGEGRTVRDVARTLGLAETTVGHWRRGDRRAAEPGSRCPGCGTGRLLPTYAYLLGSYLGDGYIALHRRGVHALSIYCADSWPTVKAEVASAMREALDTGVCFVQRQGCTEVKSYSKHWTCLFPQHGPGVKHTRRIVLEPWQEQVVEQHTGLFLRGLFHSDGCRITNWTTRRVAGEVKRYEYPRYFFSNKSLDILDLCAAGLDRLGIDHRRPRPDTISVARRAAVAALDEHVGPKG